MLRAQAILYRVLLSIAEGGRFKLQITSLIHHKRLPHHFLKVAKESTIEDDYYL